MSQYFLGDAAPDLMATLNTVSSTASTVQSTVTTGQGMFDSARGMFTAATQKPSRKTPTSTSTRRVTDVLKTARPGTVFTDGKGGVTGGEKKCTMCPLLVLGGALLVGLKFAKVI